MPSIGQLTMVLRPGGKWEGTEYGSPNRAHSSAKNCSSPFPLGWDAPWFLMENKQLLAMLWAELQVCVSQADTLQQA